MEEGRQLGVMVSCETMRSVNSGGGRRGGALVAGHPPDDEPVGAPGAPTPPGMPSWVKAGIVVLVVVLLVIVLLVFTGAHQPPVGGHGP